MVDGLGTPLLSWGEFHGECRGPKLGALSSAVPTLLLFLIPADSEHEAGGALSSADPQTYAWLLFQSRARPITEEDHKSSLLLGWAWCCTLPHAPTHSHALLYKLCCAVHVPQIHQGPASHQGVRPVKWGLSSFWNPTCQSHLCGNHGAHCSTVKPINCLSFGGLCQVYASARLAFTNQATLQTGTGREHH